MLIGNDFFLTSYIVMWWSVVDVYTSHAYEWRLRWIIAGDVAFRIYRHYSITLPYRMHHPRHNRTCLDRLHRKSKNYFKNNFKSAGDIEEITFTMIFFYDIFRRTYTCLDRLHWKSLNAVQLIVSRHKVLISLYNGVCSWEYEAVVRGGINKWRWRFQNISTFSSYLLLWS